MAERKGLSKFFHRGGERERQPELSQMFRDLLAVPANRADGIRIKLYKQYKRQSYTELLATKNNIEEDVAIRLRQNANRIPEELLSSIEPMADIISRLCFFPFIDIEEFSSIDGGSDLKKETISEVRDKMIAARMIGSLGMGGCFYLAVPAEPLLYKPKGGIY